MQLADRFLRVAYAAVGRPGAAFDPVAAGGLWDENGQMLVDEDLRADQNMKSKSGLFTMAEQAGHGLL